MKLLMCLKCSDIFNLTHKEKTCGCGEVKGKYVDDLNAEYSGDASPIGFANSSFIKAYKMQKVEDHAQKEMGKKICCDGVPFKAFFISTESTSIHKIPST